MGPQSHQPTVCAQPVDSGGEKPPAVAELTRRMAAGEETAYRSFYDAYYERLWRYLVVVTAGDEHAAGEALQAALVRVVRHIKSFPNDSVFWSWLTVLARTALSDQNRKRRRYLAFLDRFSWHARIQQAEREHAEADARLLGSLERNLAALPCDEKQLVEWKYFERRSVREIAQELQTSEKAVESRLGRVRRKLKEAVLSGLKDE
ncbi:MAG TPA: sigma-70 family RNA polymerase sigma factor [Candidatus Binatia bacterium]|nr:sigma-70 family RNA polymerase sigma factor [Candidatus Binatia bacterium]